MYLRVDLWRGRGGHGIVGVDDGDDVERHQLPDCVKQLLPRLVIVKVLLSDQDLAHEDAVVPDNSNINQVFKRKCNPDLNIASYSDISPL